jgi:hypothetical protein
MGGASQYTSRGHVWRGGRTEVYHPSTVFSRLSLKEAMQRMASVWCGVAQYGALRVT